MKIQKLGILLFVLNTLAYTEETYKKESFGVEFNILRPLLMKGVGVDSFSGGVNYFDDTRGIEIAIPFTYNKMFYDNKYYRDNDYDDTSLTVDLHYRKFFQNKANGFYLGALGRYAYLEGKSNNAKIVKQHRFGIGTEMGVRLRNDDSHTYIGASFALGAYLDKEANFAHQGSFMDMDRKKYFWDIELLKFGYEF